MGFLTSSAHERDVRTIALIVHDPDEAIGFGESRVEQQVPLLAAVLEQRQAEDGRYSFRMHRIARDDDDAGQFIRKMKGQFARDRISISWGGIDFDLPVLALEAMAQRDFFDPGLSFAHFDARLTGNHRDLATELRPKGSSHKETLNLTLQRLGIPTAEPLMQENVERWIREESGLQLTMAAERHAICVHLLWLNVDAFRNADVRRFAYPAEALLSFLSSSEEYDHLADIRSWLKELKPEEMAACEREREKAPGGYPQVRDWDTM